ncbi:small multi-drug export protein [Desulfosporosinus orientis]|uniref:small multi-drug export protein n=1 Tax=Desulfosporosinus orientis TaxID=1563 RepID=UPI001575106C|nr:small multi-drug export protein [Desulfosporosinus orientis]
MHHGRGYYAELSFVHNGDINEKLKKKEKREKNKGRIYRIWEKYGVIGLGMLSPLIMGAPLGAAIGISLGASPRRLILWMSIGIIVWTISLTHKYLRV